MQRSALMLVAKKDVRAERAYKRCYSDLTSSHQTPGGQTTETDSILQGIG